MQKILKCEDQIYHCTRCGLCQAVCPVFDVLKSEPAVSRGKIALMQGLLAGHIDFSPTVAKYMELCVGCSACQEACPSGVSTEHIFLAAKEYIADKYGLSLPKQAIVKTFASDKALNFMATLLNLYSVSKAGYLTDLVPSSVPFINKLKLLNSQLNGKVKLSLANINIKQKSPAYKILYFPGCINKYVNPSVANAAIEILKQNNCDVIIPDELLCCGMPARNIGAVDVARFLAIENIKYFSEETAGNYDYIAVDCASCGAMLKSYPELFENDPQMKEKAFNIKEKIIDINVLLTKLEIKLPETTKELTVTYHDPCHLKRSQNVHLEPRHLISGINGINFVEMNKADSCCGAAGSFFITNAKVSMAISTTKAKNITATGSDIVLTSCPSCKVGLSQGLIEVGESMMIYHPVELIYSLMKQ